jgi:hypothetical protein
MDLSDPWAAGDALIEAGGDHDEAEALPAAQPRAQPRGDVGTNVPSEAKDSMAGLDPSDDRAHDTEHHDER